MKEKFAHLLHRAEHGTHFVYFGAAAFGSHSTYAVCAGIICGIMVLAWVLHVE